LHRRRIAVIISVVAVIVAGIVGRERRSQEKTAAEKEWGASESEAAIDEPKVIMKVVKALKPEWPTYKDVVAGYKSPR
jgi:hypothetical protein